MALKGQIVKMLTEQTQLVVVLSSTSAGKIRREFPDSTQLQPS